jgi:hypothetical protein
MYLAITPLAAQIPQYTFYAPGGTNSPIYPLAPGGTNSPIYPLAPGGNIP